MKKFPGKIAAAGPAKRLHLFILLLTCTQVLNGQSLKYDAVCHHFWHPCDVMSMKGIRTITEKTNSSLRKNVYQYDQEGRLTSMQTWFKSLAYSYEISYDSLSRIASLTYTNFQPPERTYNGSRINASPQLERSRFEYRMNEEGLSDSVLIMHSDTALLVFSRTPSDTGTSIHLDYGWTGTKKSTEHLDVYSSNDGKLIIEKYTFSNSGLTSEYTSKYLLNKEGDIIHEYTLTGGNLMGGQEFGEKKTEYILKYDRRGNWRKKISKKEGKVFMREKRKIKYR
ncbi:MAG: hypothetical protein JW801_03795 [Bacteroidales bacterium]|nr:hypothetical protein [Bacteroidales bacterium]